MTHIIGGGRDILEDNQDILDDIDGSIHPVGGTKLYPTGVTPITLTSSATLDTFGAYVEIVPVDTIIKPYDPNILYLANVSDFARYYVVEIACGLAAAEVVIGRVVCGAAAASKGVLQFDIGSEILAANCRLSGRVKDDEAAANTIDVAIGYHEYE